MKIFLSALLVLQVVLIGWGVGMLTAYSIGVEGWNTTGTLAAGLFCVIVNSALGLVNIHTLREHS